MPILMPEAIPRTEIRLPYGDGASPVTQGADGLQVQKQLAIAIAQWMRRDPHVVYLPENDSPQYRHPPFAVVGRRLVRYVKSTPLMPRKIDSLDDEE